MRRTAVILTMARSLQTEERRFLRAMRVYLLQAGLAVIALAIVLYFVDVLTQAAIVAAVGSTAFVVFTVPHSPRAGPRQVIGGHLVGAGAGTAVALLLAPHLSDHRLFYLLGAFSVGLSIILMAVTHTHHPPAAGTALGLVVGPWTAQTVAFVLASALLLSLARYLLRPWLHNLIEG